MFYPICIEVCCVWTKDLMCIIKHSRFCSCMLCIWVSRACACMSCVSVLCLRARHTQEARKRRERYQLLAGEREGREKEWERWTATVDLVAIHTHTHIHTHMHGYQGETEKSELHKDTSIGRETERRRRRGSQREVRDACLDFCS